VIEHGHGTPIVMIPGLPGPWRFIAPAVHAMSTRFRALAMSLGPECTIDSDVARIAAALDERRIDRAIVCGISLGGLVALRFAAVHPHRTLALVLASTPGPGATLARRHRLYARWPNLFGPLFLLETPWAVRHELRWSHLKPLFGRPVSFSKMAKRAALIESTDMAADCARVNCPTLIVTGERRFDHIVPVDNTLGYLKAIAGASHIEIAGSGHLGSITHAQEFSRAVQTFHESSTRNPGSRRTA
jgi:pimeloyl-ACP methyl ester carboxylesterase